MVARSPLRIAWLIAIAAAVCSALVLGLVESLTAAHIGIPGLLCIAMATGGVVFAVGWFLIRRFIQDRVDLIYRSIHETRKGEMPSVMSADLFQAMNADVSAWAREKHTEILGLKERERFRREFIGNLAHELRTPIFNIQGYVLTLLEGGLEDPKVNRNFLERASAGVDRMINIVEDLELITQLESGVMAMSIGRMDLNAPIDEIIEALEMKAREKRITLRNEVPEQEMVMGDRGRLAQVFSNLFTNAINYGKEGGSCTVRAFEQGDRVLVEVADDGIGIAKEHWPRLFERFYRVGQSRARNEGGSGLGLAIVKHIVEGHGGTITVKSEEGKGTTFSFTLSRAR
ncbi:MAG TPA: ATP-binding protein [Flavobacteriales bacterium]